MTRRLAALVLVALPVTAALVIGPIFFNDPVNGANFDKITNGMTAQQVEEILGRPPDNTITVRREDGGSYNAKIWNGLTKPIMIGFDGEDLVINKAYFLDRPPSRLRLDLRRPND